MDKRELNFCFRRATKGAVVYAEVDSTGTDLKGDSGVVGTLYIRKSALNGNTPEVIRVTLEEVKGG